VAFVGIDWADAKHNVCLQAAGSQKHEFSVLEHQPDTIDEGVSSWRARFNGQPIAIGLELNNGPILSALRQSDFRVRFPVTPLTLARYREACAPSHAKDDPTDAELPLERLIKHRDQLPPLTSQSPARRARAQLVAHRRRLVGDQVRLTTRLTSALKHDFPHVLPWVHEQATAIVCDCLTPWPTLKAVQLARRSTLERFVRDHHVRSAAVIATRIQALKRATPLTTAAGVITPNALLVQALVTQRRVTLHAIEAFDHAIAQRAQRHPDCPLFSALPGAAAVVAPRLLVAFGEPRDRDAAAEERQKYAGLAPVTERRGNNTWVHWRLQCPTCLRQPCGEWAAESTRHACWARTYSPHQRDKGTSHQAAVRALAFTWIRMRFRCWQHRTPYKEAVYLNARQRRGSPLLHNHLAEVS
jgi:transposase